MESTIQTGKEKALTLLLFALIALFALWMIPLFSGVMGAQTYNETAVLNTTVNITNSAPLVTDVTLQNPINLIGYGNKSVTCNASVTDYDNESLVLNATIYSITEANPESADDGNNHYTNTSCTRLGSQDVNTSWVCSVDMLFYANNATDWFCNVTAVDAAGLYTSNISENSTVNPLIAIVVPGVLDFGEMITWQVSTERLANITNGGNRNINISVEAYGETKADAYAMNCTYGQINYGELKYNGTNGTGSFNDMVTVDNDTTMIDNYYIARRISEINDSNSTNTTFWKLRIPVSAAGICNGKILFTGSDSVATG